MDFMEVADKVLDRIKDPIQKLNQKWDEQNETLKTAAVAILFLGMLLLTGRAFMFVAVIIVGLIRIAYHEGAFNGESIELYNESDESSDNQG